MKKIEIRCQRCGRKLFFLLPKGPAKGSPTIEIKCPKDRCGATNIIDYHNLYKIVVRLKE